MPIKYKEDILAMLKSCGYSTHQLRKQKILPESTIQRLRDGKMISLESLSTICKLCHVQPGDVLLYESDNQEGQQP